MGEINEGLKKYSDNNHRIKENGGVDEYYSKVYTSGQQDGYSTRIDEERVFALFASGAIVSALAIRKALIALGIIKPKNKEERKQVEVESEEIT